MGFADVLDEQTRRISSSIDSVARLNLPTGKYAGKLDSLRQISRNTSRKFFTKLDSLKSKTTVQIDSLDLSDEYMKRFETLTKKVNAFDVNRDTPNIPSLKVPGYQPTDVVPGLTQQSGTPTISSPLADIPNTGDLKGPPAVKMPEGDLSNITGQAKAYQEDIGNITSGNLNQVQKLPETVESLALKVDGVGELQEQSSVIDGHKDKLEEVKNPGDLKEKGLLRRSFNI